GAHNQGARKGRGPALPRRRDPTKGATAEPQPYPADPPECPVVGEEVARLDKAAKPQFKPKQPLAGSESNIEHHRAWLRQDGRGVRNVRFGAITTNTALRSQTPRCVPLVGKRLNS